MLNYSNLATVLQDELLEEIRGISPTKADYTLHSLLIKYISFQPGMKKLLLVTDEHAGSLIGQYMDHIIFNNEAELITLLNSRDISYIESSNISDFIVDKYSQSIKYDLLLLPNDIVVYLNNTLDLGNLLSSGGVIMAYGNDTIMLNSNINIIEHCEVESTIFDIYQNPSTISIEITETIKKFLYIIDSTDLNDKLGLKKLVDDSIILEDYIQENRFLFKLHHMCYNINELKNALLNLYVSDIYDPILKADLIAIVNDVRKLCT